MKFISSTSLTENTLKFKKEFKGACPDGITIEKNAISLTRERKRHGKGGFTIVEVMIGMVIFSLLAIGIGASAIQSQEIAYGNIYRNTAFAVMQGYAEQVKSISFTQIYDAMQDPANVAIPTLSLSLLGSSSAGDLEMSDPLYFDQANLKKILIDVEYDSSGSPKASKTMDITITPKANEIFASTGELIGMEITLEFEWQRVPTSSTKQRSAVRIIKTDITEF